MVSSRTIKWLGPPSKQPETEKQAEMYKKDCTLEDST
jgi:hypothetical protein